MSIHSGTGELMTFEEFKNKVSEISLVLLVTIAAVVMLSAYLIVALTWCYSKGERVGYVQKFSEKGWLCKTWEGELQMLPLAGALPEKFLFSVRDQAVVTTINASLGKKVSLYYEQHKGIPTTCMGESEYFAVDSKVLE
jgi:hypothetical protein